MKQHEYLLKNTSNRVKQGLIHKNKEKNDYIKKDLLFKKNYL